MDIDSKIMFIAIVPAWNEEKRIAEVVRALKPHVDRVVVVDDGSEDHTAKQARAHGAIVLRHRVNRGQGAALETGHAYARKVDAEYVLHFDGDGQFDVKDIRPALRALQESEADVLLGSRFLHQDSGESIPWFKRWIILPLARIIDRIFTRLPRSDAHNGFRILHRQALHRIQITQDRMAHATEIPFRMKQEQLSFIEYPVHVHYREYGQGMRSGLAVVKDLIFGRFVQ